jgi:hypothetical protein
MCGGAGEALHGAGSPPAFQVSPGQDGGQRRGPNLSGTYALHAAGFLVAFGGVVAVGSGHLWAVWLVFRAIVGQGVEGGLLIRRRHRLTNL